jgi:hypothetical protein
VGFFTISGTQFYLSLKYEFFKVTRKTFQKKCALIFSKEGSKESHGNTDQKVGLRQDDIL